MTGIYNSKDQLPKRHTFQIRPYIPVTFLSFG